MAMAEEIVNVISKINICFILGGRVTIKLEVHECQMVKNTLPTQIQFLKKSSSNFIYILACVKGKRVTASVCVSQLNHRH